MKLSTKTMNALRACAKHYGWQPQDSVEEAAGPPKEFFTKMTATELLREPNLGEKALLEIEQWLDESGLTLQPTYKVPWHVDLKLTQARVLLESYGYTVTKPTNEEIYQRHLSLSTVPE